MFGNLWDKVKRINRKNKIIIICVFCLDLVLAFKLREGWRRDVGSPFVFFEDAKVTKTIPSSVSGIECQRYSEVYFADTPKYVHEFKDVSL